jgi:ABC-type cobalt transport system substrate-binding protein
MPDRKRKLRIILMHIVILPTLLYTFYFFSLAPRPWTGVDETVVEKIAEEHGRKARTPLINTDQGDLLLFVFLIGGAIGGFVAGYCWRALAKKGPAGSGDNKE